MAIDFRDIADVDCAGIPADSIAKEGLLVWLDALGYLLDLSCPTTNIYDAIDWFGEISESELEALERLGRTDEDVRAFLAEGAEYLTMLREEIAYDH